MPISIKAVSFDEYKHYTELSARSTAPFYEYYGIHNFVKEKLIDMLIEEYTTFGKCENNTAIPFDNNDSMEKYATFGELYNRIKNNNKKIIGN